MLTWVYRWRKISTSNKVRLLFIALMQAGFVGAIGIALYEQAWLTLFVAVGALGVVWLPSFLERSFRVYLPLEFELILNLFIYSSIFLGEIHGFYTRFWWWDIVLHAGSGIAFGFIGFLILFSLYRSKRLTMSPVLLALFSFSFALALGTLWEIFEFTVDSVFGLNLQKSGLRDTMWDIIVNTFGASIAGVSGYIYVRFKWKGVGLFKHHLSAFFSRRRKLR